MDDATSRMLWIVGGAIIALGAIVVYLILLKGRKMAGEHVFRASRWSRGNHLFPTQVVITPTSVLHYTPRWFGRREQSIHMSHVASVLIETNLFFSNVMIESSGGVDPVLCHGHRKRDAVKMKNLIENYQTAYYGQREAQPVPNVERR
jgi:hypothetical protein